jgi:hypothetical protein
MDIANDTITARAEVIRTERVGDFGFVHMRIELRNQREIVSTTGFAIGVLPVRGGPKVPYPFAPTAEQQAIELPPEA